MRGGVTDLTHAAHSQVTQAGLQEEYEQALDAQRIRRAEARAAPGSTHAVVREHIVGTVKHYAALVQLATMINNATTQYD